MRKLVGALCIVLLCTAGYSQYLDSLFAALTTEKIKGKNLTLFIPSARQDAIRYQKLVAATSAYYEKFYGHPLPIKIAVFDSAHWPTQVIPFGFTYYDQGWMLMDAGVGYETFKTVYGLTDMVPQLDSALAANKVKPQQMIEDFYSFYGIHEVGHYFFDSLAKAKQAERWSSEFLASYFTYQYFINKQPSVLKSFEVFSAVNARYYMPMYTSIEEFDTIYDTMGVKNYLWYHSNLYFLVKTLYGCYGDDFIPTFERLFPVTSNKEVTYNEIIEVLDKNCHQQVRQWVQQLENTTKVITN